MKNLLSLFLVGFLLINCGDDGISGLSPEQERALIQEYLGNNNLNAQTTGSGLQYIVEEPGTEGFPESDNIVVINYKQFLLDGTILEESTGTPVPLILSGLIPGLREGISLLQKGGKGLFLMPSALAFREGGNETVPPSTPVGFEIELVDIHVDLLSYESSLFSNYLIANNLTADTTDSGLQYVINELGTGGHPTINSTVTVGYKGYFLNGTVFDESAPNMPATFALAAVIAGWQEGIPLFQKGGSGLLLIPSSLAYGSTGQNSIPPNTPLIFEVELIGFE